MQALETPLLPKIAGMCYFALFTDADQMLRRASHIQQQVNGGFRVFEAWELEWVRRRTRLSLPGGALFASPD
jgi:hypothetical protein